MSVPVVLHPRRLWALAAGALALGPILAAGVASAQQAMPQPPNPTLRFDDDSIIIPAGGLFVRLPRRVCTFGDHVGDTLTAGVWRPYDVMTKEAYPQMMTYADTTFPKDMKAIVVISKLDTGIHGEIDFKVRRFFLGPLSATVPALPANPNPEKSIEAPWVPLGEMCYPAGSIATGSPVPIVLRAQRDSTVHK
jgi:hypothetical protein